MLLQNVSEFGFDYKVSTLIAGEEGAWEEEY